MNKKGYWLIAGTLLALSSEIVIVLQLNTTGAIALLGYTGGVIILVKLTEKQQHGHPP